jgi:Na+-translocating ferredoxin:NAD+ oxidoreductase subunit B
MRDPINEAVETSDVYRRLQQRIDQLPVPFPRTGSGVELRLLRALFDEEEATVALELSALTEPVSVVHRRLAKAGFVVEEHRLSSLLKGLARKGAINAGITRVRGNGGYRPVRTYGLAPLVVGMFEFQVDRLTPQYVRDFHDYLDEGFRSSVVGLKTGQMRTVPVHAEITADRTVGSYDDIRGYVARHPGPFSVINCVCRQSAGLIGEACTTSSTHETCLMIGHVNAGGREISSDEVTSILDRAEAEGHVLQPQNSRRPAFICCCCRDCCEILRNARRLPRPADAIPTRYQARVRADRCTGCRTCVKRCPTDAIAVADRVARIDPSRCIGCGLCATTCPEDAISLVRRRGAGMTPRNNTWMYIRMYLERGGPLRLLSVAVRKLLGMKI